MPTGSARKANRSPNRDVVVPCDGARHQVRLAGGVHFLKRARCPICHQPVDPSRLRRVLQCLKNVARPASANWIHKWLWIGTMGYLFAVSLAAVLLWGFSDIWWPATVLLFGPRWIILLPLVFLLPAAVLQDRLLLPLLLLGGLVMVGPVMGMRLGWRSLLPGPTGQSLAVVTFNARGGSTLVTSAENLLQEWDADVAAFQECQSALADQIRALSGWHVDVRSGVCLATRLEILSVEVMDREALEFAGGAGVVVTYQLDMNGRPIHFTNLHLDTPRAGFELIRAGRLSEGIPKTKEKSLLRGVELRRARRWVETQPPPQIVVGDFNTAPESRLYQESWGDWTNAFSQAGRGLGGTRLNGWIKVRIDHILADSHWTVKEAHLGGDAGSDHLPLIATIQTR